MKKNINKGEDDGVSEVVGFIIILGIMMMGIGLVTLYGYPQLVKEQANANAKNMERNMIVIQNDIKSLTNKNVPFQETSIQVSGGTLMVVNPEDAVPTDPYFRFLKDSIPIELSPGTTEFHPGELRYFSSENNAIIGLQNGAVNLHYFSQPGSVMIADPRWFYDTDTNTTVVTFIRIHSIGEKSQTGIGTIQMKVDQLYPVYDTANDPLITGPFPIVVEYIDPEDNYKKAWSNFFQDKRIFPINENSDPSVSELEIPGVKRLVIKSYDIEIINL